MYALNTHQIPFLEPAQFNLVLFQEGEAFIGDNFNQISEYTLDKTNRTKSQQQLHK